MAGFMNNNGKGLGANPPSSRLNRDYGETRGAREMPKTNSLVTCAMRLDFQYLVTRPDFKQPVQTVILVD